MRTLRDYQQKAAVCLLIQGIGTCVKTRKYMGYCGRFPKSPKGKDLGKLCWYSCIGELLLESVFEGTLHLLGGTFI